MILFADAATEDNDGERFCCWAVMAACVVVPLLIAFISFLVSLLSNSEEPPPAKPGQKPE